MQMQIMPSNERPREWIVRMRPPSWAAGLELVRYFGETMPPGLTLAGAKINRRLGQGARVALTLVVRHTDTRIPVPTPECLRASLSSAVAQHATPGS